MSKSSSSSSPFSSLDSSGFVASTTSSSDCPRAIDPSAHLSDLYRSKGSASANTNTLANLISAFIGTTLEGNKFFNEFLQNADDALADSIRFIIVDGYLLIAHDGLPFSAQDVDKLCEIASLKSGGKINSLEATGHKDMGFKSIFSQSDCVYVASVQTGYVFRFDKAFVEQDKGFTAFPWQIMPIETSVDALPAIASSVNLDEQVVFIVRLKAGLNLDLRLLEQAPERLLFLNSISSVTLNGLTFDLRKAEKQVSIYHYPEAAPDQDMLLSTWELRTFSMKVPDAKRTYLDTLSDYQCPRKLKGQEKVRMTLAARREGDQFVASESTFLARTLSTNEQLGFPFLVDGQFLLNAARTQLLENNEWNAWLVSMVIPCAFVWMEGLAADPDARFHASFLALLPPVRVTHICALLPDAYAKRFDDSVVRYAVLPIRHQALQPIVHTVEYPSEGDLFQPRYHCRFWCDRLHFFEQFEVISGKEFHQVIDYTVGELARLTPLGMQTYSIDHLLRSVAKRASELQTPIQHRRWLRVLAQLLQSHPVPVIRRALEQQAFFLDDQAGLSLPAKIAYGVSAYNVALAESLGIRQFHPALFEADNDPVKTWWSALFSLQRCSSLLLLRHHIFPHLSGLGSVVTAQKSVLVMRLVYRQHAQRQLTAGDFSEANLKSLKVLSLSGRLVFARECILPPAYAPNKPLVTLFNGEHANKKDPAHFVVSDVYHEEGDDLAVWRDIWHRMGAHQDLQCQFRASMPRPYIERSSRLFPLAHTYFAYLKEENFDSPRSDAVRDTHTITFFMVFYYLDHLGCCPAYAEYFWHQFIAHWPMIEANARKSQYLMGNGNARCQDPLPTYLAYLLKTLDHCPARDEVVYQTKQLWWRGLADLFDDNADDVEVLPVDLTRAQAKFIGLNTQVSIEDCIGLLNTYSTHPDNIHYKYKRKFLNVLAHVVAHHANDPDAQATITAWVHSPQACMLAADNEFYLLADVVFWPAPQAEQPIGVPGCWLHYIDGLSLEEMQRLVALFGLTQYDAVQETLLPACLAPDNLEDDTYFIDALVNKMHLAFFALYQAQCAMRDHEAVFRETALRFNQLNIQKASQLVLVCGEVERRVKVHVENGVIYYQGRPNFPVTQNKVIKLIGECLGFSEIVTEQMTALLGLFREVDQVDAWETFFAQLHYVDADEQQAYRDQMIGCLQSEIPVEPVVPELVAPEVVASPSSTAGVLSEPPDADWLIREIFGSDSDDEPVAGPSTPVVPAPSAPISVAQRRLQQLQAEADKPIEASQVRAFQIQRSAGRALKPLGNRKGKVRANGSGSGSGAGLTEDERQAIAEQEAQREKANKAIGNRGEGIVYQRIRYLIESQLDIATQTETDLGMQYKIGDSLFELEWFNKSREEGVLEGPVDLVFKKDSEVLFYVEVKSTALPNNPLFFITPNEWAYCRDERERYVLVRVFGVYEDAPGMVVYKNPFEMIGRGLITLARDGMWRFDITEGDDEAAFNMDGKTVEAVGCAVQ